MGELYRLTFPNGKAYIGITSKTARKRFAVHVSDSRRCGEAYPLREAIRKYGPESVSVMTLVKADWDYLKDLERRAIVAFGTKVPHGYNVTEGGDGVLGRPASERQRAAVSAALKGKPRSAEHCANIARAKLGSKHSEEAKAKIAAASRLRTLSPEGREKVAASKRGVPRSPETRAKLAAANTGKKLSEETRAKLSAHRRGRPMSPSARANMRLAAFRREATKRAAKEAA